MRNFVLLSLMLLCTPSFAPPPNEAAARAELLAIADRTDRNVRAEVRAKMQALLYPEQALEFVKGLIELAPNPASYTEMVLAGIMIATCRDPESGYVHYRAARKLYEKWGTEPAVAHEFAMYPIFSHFDSLSRQRLPMVLETLEYFHRARNGERPLRDRLIGEIVLSCQIVATYETFQIAKPFVDRAIEISKTPPGYTIGIAFDLVQIAERKALSDAVIVQRYALVVAINVDSGHSEGDSNIRIDSLEFVARNAKEVDLWPARFRAELKDRVVDFTKEREQNRRRPGCGGLSAGAVLGGGLVLVAGGLVAYHYFFR